MTTFKTGWVQNTCVDSSSYTCILESAQSIQLIDDEVCYAICVRDIPHNSFQYQSTEYFVTVRIIIWWWLPSLAETYIWFYLQNKVAFIPSIHEFLRTYMFLNQVLTTHDMTIDLTLNTNLQEYLWPKNLTHALTAAAGRA